MVMDLQDEIREIEAMFERPIEQKAIDSSWSLFCCRGMGSDPSFSI